MDQFGNMHAFILVVDTGSFTEAARQLGFSKSVVTKRVNQLEAYLGAQLLRRTTRQVTVTEIGAAYYERCLDILKRVDDANSEIGSLGLKPRGLLRVSCVICFAVAYLDRDLCEFQALYPDVTIELVHTDRMVNPLHENFDISIQMLDVPGASVMKRVLAEAKHLLVASPQYLQIHGIPKIPNDLAAHKCVHNTYFGAKPEWVVHGSNDIIRVLFEPTMLTNNCWLMKEAAVCGNGIGLLPLFFVEDELLEGRLVPILTDYRFEEIWLTVYWPQSRHIPLKTRLLIDFLMERYSTAPPPWVKKLSSKLPQVLID